jgi:hypothetical protein
MSIWRAMADPLIRAGGDDYLRIRSLESISSVGTYNGVNPVTGTTYDARIFITSASTVQVFPHDDGTSARMDDLANNGDDNMFYTTCFAGDQLVKVLQPIITPEALTPTVEVLVPIHAVRVGDVVLAADRNGRQLLYSKVVAVPHPPNSARAVFTTIHLKSGAWISLTPDHLLLVLTRCESAYSLVLLAAQDVKLGMCLLSQSQQVATEDKIISIDTQVKEDLGVYTIVTDEEMIVVNGIIASPFAINHAVPHAFYRFHRLWYFEWYDVLTRLYTGVTNWHADAMSTCTTAVDFIRLNF